MPFLLPGRFLKSKFLFIPALFILFFFSPAEPKNERVATDEVLKIGVSSMITPVETVRYYQEIVDYIGEELGMPVEMVHRRSYEEMDRLLQNGEVKIAFICSYPYVKDRETFGVELLVVPKVNGKTTYHSYIIVHKDSPINSFSELKGKTFAFTDPRSNTGRLYPLYLLKTMGKTPEEFFKKTIYSYSHNKSVELVAKKKVDGAAVESIVFEYMLKTGSPYASQVKIIKRSPPFGIPPVVVTKDMNPELGAKIRNALLNMHRKEKGKRILDSMMIEGFVLGSDNSYDSIRDMERVLRGEKKNNAHDTKLKRIIYFGVIPKDNPRILYERYQPLLDYLSERTGLSFELIIKKNYEETVKAIGTGEIDMAFLGPVTYLEAKAGYGAICILRPKGFDGTGFYRSIFMKKIGSPLQDVSGLKGKRVAFAAVRSTSGNLIPRYMLANHGIHLSELSGYTNFDYHDSVAKAVLRGQYDAGSVRDTVARRYEKLGLERLAESRPIPTGPLVVNANVPYSIVESIKKSLFEIVPEKPEYKPLLEKLDDELRNGFMPATDSDYSEIRMLINSVPDTCGKGCHPRIRL
ncbi:MAG: phosphate/phosphite/phosphonate ABC transporter substrate-binding protein [Thermodesulfovibrionales bacterium]